MMGKIKNDGSLEIFKEKYVIIDGVVITNPNNTVLRSIGYKPISENGYVIETTDSNLVVKYVERANYIQLWHETEDGYMGEEIE